MEKEYIKTIRKKIGHDTLMVCGASIILYKDDKILLQKRTDNGYWAIHGGSVEVGEKVEEAAARELFEETGLTALSLKYFTYRSGEDMFYTYPNGDKVYIIDIIFECDLFSGAPKADPAETEDLEWFSFNALPQNIHPIDKSTLEEFVLTKTRAHKLFDNLLKLEMDVANSNIDDIRDVMREDFTEFGSSGKVYHFADYINYPHSNKTGESYTISGFSVKMLDETTAQTTYTSTLGKKHALRSSIWKQTDGKWKLIFHQGTKIGD